MRQYIQDHAKAFKIAGLVVGAVLLALGAGAFFWLKQSPVLTEAVTRKVERAVGIEPVDPFAGMSHLTLLVLGCDADLSRGGKKVLRKYARSDMMLVARLDFVQREITAISIPRDTLVSISSYGSQKINAYHSYGGPDLAKEAVETLLPGVGIDRVVVLDFDAFQEMVDAAGGVEVDVQKRMKWTDKAAKLYIDLKPGKQLLDGYNAMGFVRFRHTDSDFKRTERQREFLLAFKKQVLANPMRLPTVVNKAAAVLNGAVDNRELVSLAEFAQKVDQANIRMDIVPTVESSGYNLLPDKAKLAEVLRELHLVDGLTASL